MIIVLNTSETLKKDDRGDNVKGLQKALAVLGHSPGAADGIFGKGTSDAVRAFQSEHGLGSDGVAGKRTLATIVEGLEAIEAARDGQASVVLGNVQGSLMGWIAGGREAAADPSLMDQWLAEGEEHLASAFREIEGLVTGS